MRLEGYTWVLAAVLALEVGDARADAIGPPPTVDDCPRGATSHVLNMMTHSQSAYCAPTLCREGARAPAAGATCEVVELEIGERVVSPPSPGGHGAEIPRNVPPARPVARLAEALRTCDARDDETPIEANRRADPFFGMLGGPPITQVPVGCHRIRVWLMPQPPTPVAPTPPPTTAPTATDPPQSPTPPAPSTAPPPASAGGCACTTAPSRAAAPVSVAIGLGIAIAVCARRRRGRRRLA